VQQDVSLVRQLVALLDQPAGSVARVFRAPTDLRWNELAGEEMLANVHGQVGPTARAQVRAMVEEVIGQLVLPEALVARRARGHRVTPAEHEEQSPLLVVQLEGSPAVEMNDPFVVERNRIVGLDRLDASRARRFSHCFTWSSVKIARVAYSLNDLFD